jgi:hypothetical protein
MVQGQGIVAPLDWMLVPNIFPQPPQNISIEISIHFLMYNAVSVKKATQH